VTPPLVGVAVKVTLVPEQIKFPGLAEILTLAATFGFTAITIAFDVAGLPETQEALEVITQVMLFPFAKAAFVYVGLLIPTFVAPNFHW
jgi:hypothetical protein